ncbi:MAG: hypothetical protein ABI598_04660 [Chloroflexota bacterium]
MDVAGSLAGSIGENLAGLVGGMVRAVGQAASGVANVLQAALPGYGLAIVVVAGVILLGWLLIRR